MDLYTSDHRQCDLISAKKPQRPTITIPKAGYKSLSAKVSGTRSANFDHILSKSIRSASTPPPLENHPAFSSSSSSCTTRTSKQSFLFSDDEKEYSSPPRTDTEPSQRCSTPTLISPASSSYPSGGHSPASVGSGHRSLHSSVTSAYLSYLPSPIPEHLSIAGHEIPYIWSHASLLFHCSEYPEALRTFEHLQHRSGIPQHLQPRLWLNIGILHLRLREYYYASEAFISAVRLAEDGTCEQALGIFLMGIAQFDAGYPSKAAKSFEMCDGVYCLMSGIKPALQDEAVSNDQGLEYENNSEDRMILNMNNLCLDFVLRRFKVRANRRICIEAAGKSPHEPTWNLSRWKIHRIPSDLLLEAPPLAPGSNNYAQTDGPKVLSPRLGNFRVMNARSTGLRAPGKQIAALGQQVEIADPHAEVGTSHNGQHELDHEQETFERVGEIEPSRKLGDKIERLTWEVEKCLAINGIERNSLEPKSDENKELAHAQSSEQTETFFSDESPTTPSRDETDYLCDSDVPPVLRESEDRPPSLNISSAGHVDAADPKCRAAEPKEEKCAHVGDVKESNVPPSRKPPAPPSMEQAETAASVAPVPRKEVISIVLPNGAEIAAEEYRQMIETFDWDEEIKATPQPSSKKILQPSRFTVSAADVPLPESPPSPPQSIRQNWQSLPNGKSSQAETEDLQLECSAQQDCDYPPRIAQDSDSRGVPSRSLQLEALECQKDGSPEDATSRFANLAPIDTNRSKELVVITEEPTPPLRADCMMMSEVVQALRSSRTESEISDLNYEGLDQASKTPGKGHDHTVSDVPSSLDDNATLFNKTSLPASSSTPSFLRVITSSCEVSNANTYGSQETTLSPSRINLGDLRVNKPLPPTPATPPNSSNFWPNSPTSPSLTKSPSLRGKMSASLALEIPTIAEEEQPPHLPLDYGHVNGLNGSQIDNNMNFGNAITLPSLTGSVRQRKAYQTVGSTQRNPGSLSPVEDDSPSRTSFDVSRVTPILTYANKGKTNDLQEVHACIGNPGDKKPKKKDSKKTRKSEKRLSATNGVNAYHTSKRIPSTRRNPHASGSTFAPSSNQTSIPLSPDRLAVPSSHSHPNEHHERNPDRKDSNSSKPAKSGSPLMRFHTPSRSADLPATNSPAPLANAKFNRSASATAHSTTFGSKSPNFERNKNASMLLPNFEMPVSPTASRRNAVTDIPTPTSLTTSPSTSSAPPRPPPPTGKPPPTPTMTPISPTSIPANPSPTVTGAPKLNPSEFTIPMERISSLDTVLMSSNPSDHGQSPLAAAAAAEVAAWQRRRSVNKSVKNTRSIPANLGAKKDTGFGQTRGWYSIGGSGYGTGTGMRTGTGAGSVPRSSAMARKKEVKERMGRQGLGLRGGFF
ncbi:MAG: hypothetical protein M1831_000235 [Alyxoria varia]|nr:MAG: hypothetical protein M1831_000235 [Alyxoria varia]